MKKKTGWSDWVSSGPVTIYDANDQHEEYYASETWEVCWTSKASEASEAAKIEVNQAEEDKNELKNLSEAVADWLNDYTG